jgi:hypothetical protein
MDAEEIIARTVETYSACATYRDRGYAVFGDIRIEFSTQFKRPDYFYFHFQDYGPNRGKSEKFSTLWSREGETVFQWVRTNSTQHREPSDLNLGIAGAVGCSAGAAGIIAGELFPDLPAHKKSFLHLEDFRLDGSDTIAEVDCYVIKAIGRHARENRVWITKQDFSLRRFYRDLSSTAAQMEAQMKEMFENKELMAQLAEKGIALPSTDVYTDHRHVTEYFYTEVDIDQDFDFPAKPV